MSSHTRRRRWLAIGTGAVALLIVGLGLGVAAAQTRSNTASQTIICPSVSDRLPAVPAQARAEVDRNLALLDTQIAEANRRLVTTRGQGGPNFVNNAILGPLKDKRVATIDRIAIAIGRHAQRPAGLESLAACRLSNSGAAPAQPPGQPPAQPAQPPAQPAQPPAQPAAPGTISCPTVADKLPPVPAQAEAEVARNLDLLNTQIAEANQRLVDTVGQGGPNFVNNAILGPLKDKRFATINRIATAIGRHAARPEGLAESLSACTLVK
jgi:hypothetical protein